MTLIISRQFRNIKIMKTLSQLGAVLKKSFLIKSKTPISSLVEIFLPVILLFLFTRIDDKRLVENSFRPFLCLIYSTSMGGLVSNVVTEREQRISEMMKILGLPNWIFYSSWFIFYAITLAVSSLLVSLVMVFSDVAPDGNVFTVFIYYLLYSVSSIAFSLFLSSPFDSAKLAQTVGFLVYGLVSILGAFIKPDWSKGTKLVVTFFLPPLGFSLGYDSAAPRGMTWDNISVEKDNLSVSDAMLMMFLSTIFFMLCYVYFDQVLPHEVGFRRPWYFPFQCLMRSSKKSSSSWNSSHNDEHDELVRDQAAGPSSVTVETKGLSKRYNASRQALNDVNLTLKSGELTVLLGRNGAGKTTLINILTGMTEPSSGTARVFGHWVHGELDKVRENTGFCPQHDIQWAKLTVKEHFEIFGAFRDLPAAVIKERMNRLLASIGLKDKENSPVSKLSGGMKRKLSVALAFLGDSKFVILDEPTSGLDPLSRRHMWTVLGKMREDRVVLLSTHYMDEAEVLGERVVILSDGQVRANGSVSELKREFDCGYELVFELSKPPSSAFNMSSFQKVVKRIVSSAEFPHPLKGSQLVVTITLPVDAAEFIPDLLQEIKEKFGEEDKTFKSGIQIKSKRLEEVFMAIALDGEVDEITVPAENEADFDGMNAVENGGNAAPSRIAVEYVGGGAGGMSLLLSQIVGTVIKRLRLFVREIRPSIMQNLFPLLMIVLGIVTVKLTRRKEDLSADEAKDKPEKWIENFISDMAMVTFIQFAFTSISSGIVANLARESQTHSKFLQYIAGLMPLAYWLGSFLADVFEYFALPFSYTSISLAALNLSIPISPFLALLACFGPGVVAQTYAISVLITNPVMSKLFSYFVSLILGLILPIVFFYLRVSKKIETVLPILETICRIFPSFNLGEGFLSVNIYATARLMGSKMSKKQWKSFFEKLPNAATASSVYDYSACGAAIIWMIGMTPLLFAVAVFVDDLRYKNKTTFSSTFAPPPEPVGFVEDESVAQERAKARRSAPGSMAMLAVDVSKQWISNSVLAVNRVPLAVARNGEIFTLLGENGAGKTTLMTMAIGQILPSEGNIFIDKHNTRTELKQARQLIGYCPQFDALLPPLTVKDHLRLFARIKGIKSTSIDFAVDRTIEWLGLGSYQNAKAKSLSGGYKRRLSLAIALMGKPEILILDEPSCGMDPVARRQMWKVMESASRDCALILTTHSMEEAEAVSTRLGIMSRGRMMCIGSATELREKFSNGVEVFVQTKVPGLDPLIVEQTTLGQTSFVALCQRHSQKRAARFVTSGLNIMIKQNSADSAVATSFAEWWAQETLNDELETLIRSKIVGVCNFEASGRSLRFVVEPLTKILTFDFVSEIFTFLEHSKKEGLVVDYSVTQNSLDQVFRSIAAREQEPAYIGAAILAEAVPLE